MRKIILLLNFCLLSSIVFSQDYFDEKSKKLNLMKMVNLAKKGVGFDYEELKNKTLIIPSYSQEHSYNSFVLGNQYSQFDNQEDKSDYYKTIWKLGIDESYYKSSKYSIGTLNPDNISEEDYDKYIFLSFFKDSRSLDYLLFWALDKKGKEYLFYSLCVNDLDFGDKNDIRLAFNILEESLSAAVDFVSGRDFSSYEEKQRVYASLGMLSQQEYESKVAFNFISISDSYTLLVPEEEKSEALDEMLESWSYSTYEYVPNSVIEQRKADNSPDYMYLRALTADNTYNNGLILATNKDFILFQNTVYGMSAKDFKHELQLLASDLNKKKQAVSPENTINFAKVEFNYQGLPEDLSTSKIAYVNATEQQYYMASWVNKSFANKMDKYPYKYVIVDAIKDIPLDCKYRVKLKSVYMTYEITTTHENGRVEQDDTTKEVFFLFLEDIKTGEKYLFNKEHDFYNYVFRDFVKEVSK